VSTKYICNNVEKLLRHIFVVHIYHVYKVSSYCPAPLDQKFWFRHRRGYLLLRTFKTCIKKSMGQMLPHKSSSHTQTHEKSQASPNTRKPEKLWSIQQKQRGYCPNYHLRIQGILINHRRKERQHCKKKMQ